MNWKTSHTGFLTHNFTFNEVFVAVIWILNERIATKFCTCHDRCAGFMTRNWIMTKCKFHQICVLSEKLWVEWAVGYAYRRINQAFLNISFKCSIDLKRVNMGQVIWVNWSCFYYQLNRILYHSSIRQNMGFLKFTPRESMPLVRTVKPLI